MSVVIRDLQTGGFSSHTEEEDIFQDCLESFLENLWTEEELREIELEVNTPEFRHYLVDELYEYEVLEPTPELIAEWEAYHNKKFE